MIPQEKGMNFADRVSIATGSASYFFFFFFFVFVDSCVSVKKNNYYMRRSAAQVSRAFMK